MNYVNETETVLVAQSRSKQLTGMREAAHADKRQHCRQLHTYVLPGRIQRKWETSVETKFVCYNLLLADLLKNVPRL